MTDIETTIEYYKELLLYQYINSPNAKAVIGLLCSQAIADLIPISVNDAFDLDTAIGPQLDILGEYVGVNRSITAPVDRLYFTANDQENLATATYGFTDYNDSTLNSSIFVYSYIDSTTSEYSLNDEEYRIFLKLKVALNSSNNTLYSIVELLFDLFDTSIVIFDQFDMSIIYFVSTDISRIVGMAYSEGLLPKPMGVLINGVFVVPDTAKIWSLNSYTDAPNFVGGFTDYNDTTNSDMYFLSYGDKI